MTETKSSSTSLLLLLVIVALLLPECSQGLQCYQCGSDDGDALSCDLFAVASMWRQFAVECPEEPRHYCAKTVTYQHHEPDDQPSEVRGCAAAENAYQVANPIGCGHSGHTVLCLCDSYLCNGSTSPTSISLTLLTFCLIVVSMCFYRDGE